jgi:hypothetical protein
MRRARSKHIARNAVDEILRHQSCGENPTAGLHALRKPDLAGAELDGKQRLRRA